MNKLIENCLYRCDRKEFDLLRGKVAQLNVICNGYNIVQDDIFGIIKNYARLNDTPLEILRYPIDDAELCACTFLREGRIFVLINAAVPFGKQIFAAAHELYHIRCYFEGSDPEFPQKGSILKSAVLDEADVQTEDMEANAFAGLFLAPGESLHSQISIYGIDTAKLKSRDIYTLMDIFAIPYKAMILRLYEEGIINENQAELFLSISPEQVEKEINLCGIGRRWQKLTKDSLEFGSLEENLHINDSLGFVAESRIEADKESLEKIKAALAGK